MPLFNKTNLVGAVAGSPWKNGNGTVDKNTGNFPFYPAGAAPMTSFLAGDGYIAATGLIKLTADSAYIQTPTTDILLTNTSKFTFEFWYKHDASSSTKMLALAYSSVSGNGVFIYVTVGNVFRFYTQGVGGGNAISALELTVGSIYHVCFIKDGATFKIKINNVWSEYSSQTAYSAGDLLINSPLHFLGHPLNYISTQAMFWGAYYDEVLSDARIAENYARGSAMLDVIGRNTGDTMALLQKSVVAYNANGGAGTIASEDAIETDTYTVKANAFTRAGFTFVNFNTAANGSGTSYAPAATFAMGTADVTLYAQWAAAGGTRKKPLANNTGCGVGI